MMPLLRLFAERTLTVDYKSKHPNLYVMRHHFETASNATGVVDSQPHPYTRLFFLVLSRTRAAGTLPAREARAEAGPPGRKGCRHGGRGRGSTGGSTRLTGVAVENGLDKRKSCRQMAAELGRSPSTVADEVSRNRSVSRGPGKGRPGRRGARRRLRRGCCRGRAAATAASCAATTARSAGGSSTPPPGPRRWPTRSCRRRARASTATSAVRIDDDGRHQVGRRARALAGADRGGARGAVPGLRLHHIPLDRARVRGNVEPRAAQEVRVQEAHARPPARGHGPRRGALVRGVHGASRRGARLRLRDGHRDRPEVRRSVPADAVPAPCKFQLALLMPGKDAASTEGALDALEKAVGKAAFARMFGPRTHRQRPRVRRLRRHRALGAARSRQALLGAYCDARQSQQKGGCERNHVELRKILPKGAA